MKWYLSSVEIKNLQNKTLEALFEPGDSFLLGDAVCLSNTALVALTTSYTETGATKVDIEIHTEDTGVRIVFHTEINVFRDTETEVTGLGEVATTKLEKKF